jgi:glucosamine 6-phosphate synthetase-like amidotransferase/phosphosugar isomerase protein
MTTLTRTDCRGDVVVIRNGIVENYLDRAELRDRPRAPLRADTEVKPHLISRTSTEVTIC